MAALLTALPQLSSQQMVDVAWASATLQLKDAALLDVMQENASTAVDQYHLRDLGTLAWAFAKLQHPCDQLLSRITARATYLLKREAAFTATDVALLLWSFGKLRYSPSCKVLLSPEIISHHKRSDISSQMSSTSGDAIRIARVGLGPPAGVPHCLSGTCEAACFVYGFDRIQVAPLPAVAAGPGFGRFESGNPA